MQTPTVAGVVPSHYILSFHHKKSPEMLLHVRGWDVSSIIDYSEKVNLIEAATLVPSVY